MGRLHLDFIPTTGPGFFILGMKIKTGITAGLGLDFTFEFKILEFFF
jgi:hypothetical protein